MIQHQIEALAAAGVTDVVLAVNYRPEVMVSVLKKTEEEFGINITFSVETEPLGTGMSSRTWQVKDLESYRWTRWTIDRCTVGSFAPARKHIHACERERVPRERKGPRKGSYQAATQPKADSCSWSSCPRSRDSWQGRFPLLCLELGRYLYLPLRAVPVSDSSFTKRRCERRSQGIWIGH